MTKCQRGPLEVCLGGLTSSLRALQRQTHSTTVDTEQLVLDWLLMLSQKVEMGRTQGGVGQRAGVSNDLKLVWKRLVNHGKS